MVLHSPEKEVEQNILAPVTVLIVNWNSGKLLAECLEHLLDQTIQPANVIVVDNASSDNSADVAKAFKSITLKKSSINLGFAAGNNLALAECDTEFVALLNPDAFPDSKWLESLLLATSKYPDVAAFGSRQLMQANERLLDGIGDSYHMSGLVWRERHGTLQSQADLTEREIFSPCAAAALYRRSAFIDMGGFDEDFFCYMEDVDLGFRLRLAGHKAMYVPEAVVHHVGSATTGGQHSDFSIYHGHRNLVWTFLKNMPGTLLLLLLPLHLLLNSFSIIWFSAKGQGNVIIRAKWDAIKGIPVMWCKRKEIQANRQASVLDIWRVLDKRILPSPKSNKYS